MPDKNEAEVRVHAAGELRFVQDAAKPGVRTLQGYAFVYNALSEDLGGFRERIAPGAAKLAADVRALWNHDANHVLGRSKSGTLRLADDARGMGVSLDLPDTQMGRDLPVMIERGDVSGMSFRFSTAKDQWAKSGGEWLRTLLDISISEVSIVAFPAYPDTSIALRSLQALAAEGEANGLADAKRVEERRRRRLRLAGL